MVFQRPNPFPTMSICDNVVAGLKLQGVRNQQDARRDRRAVAAGANLWDEVKDRLDKPGGGLSGGQQQRLCIARAIAVQPRGAADGRAVLGAGPDLDAGDRGSDPELKQEYTIVIVTHNMQQAARVSEQTAFFNLAGDRQAGPAGRDRRHREDLLQPDARRRTEDYISGRFG